MLPDRQARLSDEPNARRLVTRGDAKRAGHREAKRTGRLSALPRCDSRLGNT